MLTLPTEVTDNKNLQGIEPILLIRFTDLAFFVASQAVTISSQAYQDLLREGFSLSLQELLPEKLNSIWSVSGLRLQLLDWRGTLRSSMVGSSPDLTGSDVEVYVKYGTATTVLANAVQIFEGTISDYSVERDIMTLEVQSTRPALADVPTQLIPGETTVAKPIQFGDFVFSNDPRIWGLDANTPHYAICPLIFIDEDKVGAKWIVAAHQMDQMPTASNLTDEDNAYAFVVRDNTYQHCKLDSGSSTITVTNTSTEATVEVSGTTEIEVWLFRTPTAEGSGNTVSAWQSTIDGKTVTDATVDDSETKLSVDTFLLDEFKESQYDHTDALNGVVIRLGTVTGTNSFIARFTDGTNTATTTFSSSDSNTWIHVSLPGSGADAFDDIEANFRVEVEQLIGGESCDVQIILLKLRTQNLSSTDKFLYLRCSGKEFSGTWNSRKTSGSPMNYVPEFIESLLRDIWSYGDADIDMDSFDDVNTYLTSTVFAIGGGTIFQQQDAYRLLSDICEIYNLSLIFSSEKKWRLRLPLKGVHDFSNSGTGTPGDEDIYTDSETITNNEFDRHPILRGTFRISRTNIKSFSDRLVINYIRTHQGFIQQRSAGSGRKITLNNWLLSDNDSATAFRNAIDNHLLAQHSVVEFETFSNAVGVEIGDIINVRHDDLNDDMLDATVNTQKWMVQEVLKSWRPHVIKITAIELK